MPGTQSFERMQNQCDARLHVEHARAPQATLGDSAWHGSDRSKRIDRVVMAKQQNRPAAALAGEIDLYTAPRLQSRLASELNVDHPVRLVVDTGLHALGWSRRQAVDYLVENTPMAKVEIEAEIDRYITYPGQALSYMVGRLEILRIREAAEKALGERFDIKEFHDLVLGGGALPLSVLDAVVAEWVAENGARE